MLQLKRGLRGIQTLLMSLHLRGPHYVCSHGGGFAQGDWAPSKVTVMGDQLKVAFLTQGAGRTGPYGSGPVLTETGCWRRTGSWCGSERRRGGACWRRGRKKRRRKKRRRSSRSHQNPRRRMTTSSSCRVGAKLGMDIMVSALSPFLALFGFSRGTVLKEAGLREDIVGCAAAAGEEGGRADAEASGGAGPLRLQVPRRHRTETAPRRPNRRVFGQRMPALMLGRFGPQPWR
jgi:hypothetical protein